MALTEVRHVLTGWATSLNAADAVVPSAYDAEIAIEYPIGTVGGSATMTTTPGDTVTGPTIALAAEIPWPGTRAAI